MAPRAAERGERLLRALASRVRHAEHYLVTFACPDARERAAHITCAQNSDAH